MGRMRTLVLVACIAVTSSALAACGDSGEESSSGEGGAASAEPIKIGTSLPLSGAAAANATSLKQGYELAVEDVNAAGGIDGRKLELTIEDDKFEPSLATNLTRKLITSDRVVALLGTYGSSLGLAASAIAEQYEVPNIQPYSSAPEMVERGLKFLFNTYPPSADNAASAAEFANAVVKPTTAAIVYVDNPFAITGAKAMREGLAKGGVKLVADEKVATGQSSYTSVLTKIKQAGPDALMLIVYPPDHAVIMKQVNQLQITPKLIYSQGAQPIEPAIREALGDTQDGVVFTPPNWFLGAPNEAAADVAKRYAERYGKDPYNEVIQGYAAVQILADALKRAGSTDGEKLRAALAATDLDTVAGHITFDGNGQGTTPTLVTQLQDSKVVLVWPLEDKQADWRPFASGSDQ